MFLLFMSIFKDKIENRIFLYTVFFSVVLNFSIYIYMPYVMDTFYNINGNYYYNLIRNGRFLRNIVDNIVYFLGNSFLVPYFSLICSSILYGFSFVFIYKLFEMKESKFQILLPAAIILPCFNLINPFINDVPVFAFNFLLSIISVYLIINTNFKFKFLIFVLINLFILMTYQLSFFFSISLIYLCILDKFADDYSFNRTMKLAIVSFISIIISVTLYYCIISLTMPVFNNRNAEFSLFNVLKTYAVILVLPFKSYMQINETLISRIAFFVVYLIILYLLVKLIISIKNNNINLIFILFLIVIFPVAINSILLILKNPSRGMYQELFIVIIPYMLLSKNIDISEREYSIINKILFISLSVILVSNFYTANARYQEIKNRNDAERAYVIELVSSIRQCEGYTTESKIAFLNNTKGNLHDDNLEDFYEEYVQERFGTEYSSSIIRFNYGDGLERALNIYGAFKFKQASNDDVEMIKSLAEIKDMPVYPNYGAIKKIGDIIVVKFSEP